MKIRPFKVEEWMNEHEKYCKHNLADTCVKTLSLDELFEISQTDKETFLNEIASKALGYGHIQGSPDYKKGVCKLYDSITPDDVISTIGAAGANHLVFYSLIEPNDRVISVLPTYQQLYSIPASFGADVQYLHLTPENAYLPDLSELRSLITANTKMICLNNPNNPTGALIPVEMLKEIVEIARKADAYVLCDEVYRGLSQSPEMPSIADLYEKGISVCSMSKVFSLAGLRLGWIASKSGTVIEECLKHREYNMISCSMTDESFAALALENADKILERNKKIIKENLEILDGWVKNQKYVSYVKPKAGTTALLQFQIPMSAEEFCRKASLEKGIFLTTGECFELENCARIGYCGDSIKLKEGLAELSAYLEEVNLG